MKPRGIKNPANPQKLNSLLAISRLFPYISLKNYTYLESGAQDESNDIWKVIGKISNWKVDFLHFGFLADN